MLGLPEIRAAHQRIAKYVRRTPVVRDPDIDAALNGELYIKCENLQEAGAFKSRGACNAVFSLSDDEARQGVVTHSSGNHAAALARAAGLRGIPAYIVMPTSARPQKVAAVQRFGGQITFCEPTLADRERTAAQILADTGATLIHPYDDERIIAGQGTAALELLEEISDLQVVVAPVGGGGLLSGTALAVKGTSPEILVWGAEPRGADDAFRSWTTRTRLPSLQPNTIADGLLTSLGERNFPIICEYVDDILLTGDEEIVRTVGWVHERLKMVVEPSGVVPLAALRDNGIGLGGRRIGLIFSGGNFDLTDLPT